MTKTEITKPITDVPDPVEKKMEKTFSFIEKIWECIKKICLTIWETIKKIKK
ncbi:MAG: hypothetical protein RSD51_03390 [Malacoplasma sp.]